ncbi:MAG: hypothetical protein ABIP20_07685, partial [Chthoniobacteraceae bacterium]
IVLHALERDVERRYQHVSEIRTDVENVTGTPGAQASPPVRQAAVPAATVGAPPAANPEDDEDTEEAGEEHPFFAWAWKFVPLVAILLAFFNPWGGKAWYYFAAGCSVLAVSSGFFRTSTKAEAKETPPFRRESWWFSRSRGMQKFLGITIGAVLVLSLLAFFSFRMQVTTTADQSGVVRNLYNVTVGLGDPWLYLFRRLTGTRSGLESGMNIVAGSALFGFAALFAGTAVTRLTREQKRRGKLADASGDAPQRAFFWHAIAGGVFFIAGAVGAVVHAQRSEANGGILADAVHEVHPDFARPGSTSIALKKAIADELKLTPDQLEKINQSLNRHYLEFLKLENDHSSYRVENGHVVKTIQPFPDRSFALAQRLANELRAVAGQEIVPAPERGAVWKLRLFRHAGEFNVRAELWEKDGKYHREESWEREGRRIMGGKSGDTLTDMNLAFGTYATDWAAMQTNIHEPKPDDAHHSWVFGWDTMQFFINQTRQAELARMLATDPKAVIQSGNPHVALVTQAGTPLGRACVETQLRNFGIAFRKDTTPDDLVGKLETLLGSDISAPTPPATERQ